MLERKFPFYNTAKTFPLNINKKNGKSCIHLLRITFSCQIIILTNDDTVIQHMCNYLPLTRDLFAGTRTNQDGHREPESAGLWDLARGSACKYLD